MPSRRIPPSWIAVALALLGCGNKAADGPGSAAHPVNALLVKDPEPTGPCFIQAASNPPDPVFLLVTSQPITCAEAKKPVIFCGPAVESFEWELCIPLDADLAPATIQLNAYTPFVLLASVEPSCTGALGVVQNGTVVISEVDPTSIDVTISGTDDDISSRFPAMGSVSPDGTYDAPRCP